MLGKEDALIYANIKELADKKGISISELEKRAGVPNGIIGKWRNRSPRVDKLVAVANALGVSITRLLKERD